MTPTLPVLAWHGDPELHAAALRRMRVHAEADALIQGDYIITDDEAPDGYRGCFYACLVAELRVGDDPVDGGPDPHGLVNAVELGPGEPVDGWHDGAARLLGIAPRFGGLAEYAFEYLPPSEASAFAVALTAAIQPGVDLDRAADAWIVRTLTDPEYGVRQHATPEGQRLIDTTVAMIGRRATACDPSTEEWYALRAGITTYLRNHAEDELQEPLDVWVRSRRALEATVNAAWPLRAESLSSVAGAAADVRGDAPAGRGHDRYRRLADQLLQCVADAAPGTAHPGESGRG